MQTELPEINEHNERAIREREFARKERERLAYERNQRIAERTLNDLKKQLSNNPQ